MAGTGNGSPEIVPKCRSTRLETDLMPRRRLYVVDLDTGKEIESIDVEGKTETEITALERQLLSLCADDLVVRDSRFDREDRQP